MNNIQEEILYDFQPGAKYLFVTHDSIKRKIDGRKTLYIFETKIDNFYKFRLLTITFPGEKSYEFSNSEMISKEILDMYYITKISESNDIIK